MYCDCGNFVEGATKKCGSCNRQDRKDETEAKKPIKSKFNQNPIKKESSKRAQENREYSRESKKFLEENSSCQTHCGSPSQEVHHKAGRIGWLLLFKPYWLAVCRECHKEIELNPEFAIQEGYSILRTNVNKPDQLT